MTPVPPELEVAARAGRNEFVTTVHQRGGTPLRDGDLVTLLHLGAAERVSVRHWLDIFPELPEFTRLDGADLWGLTFPLSPEARIEYKIAVHTRGRHRLRLDPFNPEHAPNPWGASSELRGSAYEPPPWTRLDLTIDHGTVTWHEVPSAVFGDVRPVHLYRPVGDRPRALLVVHDGSDYLEFANLVRVLDNCIAAGDIDPVAAVLTDPVDRMGEYRGNTEHADHVVNEVLPFARAEVGAVPAIAMGASLGGVASLHATWSYPGTFDGLILQAGSFVTELGPHGRGPVFNPVIRFMRRFSDTPRPLPERIHLSCGVFDGLIAEARTMADRLDRRGVAVGMAENLAGHDWRAWRDLLRPALRHVLPREGP